jgi:hypothetical protein
MKNHVHPLMLGGALGGISDLMQSGGRRDVRSALSRIVQATAGGL